MFRCKASKIWSGISMVLLLLCPAGLWAQFQANGNAVSTGGGCYELTADAGNEGGSMWYTQKFNLTQPFNIQFTINLGCKSYSNGADGIGFVFQPLSINAGSAGGGMGFGGINPSLDVEFDTYQNSWDPNYCHVVIEKNGDVDHTVAADLLAGPVATSPIGATLPDCKSHAGRITWDPVSKTLKVYFDCSMRLSYTGDIINTIFGGNPNVYWGFTAGTGGASNFQGVCVENSYLSNLRDTAVCAGAPVQLLAHGGVTYAWTPATGLSSTTVSNPVATPAQTTHYFVTATDSCGYPSKDSVLITVKSIHDTITQLTNILCFGGSTGSATVAAVGGTGPFTYSWSTGVSTAQVTGLAANTYTAQITDAQGCVASIPVTTTQPSALSLVTTAVAATCKGMCNGQVGSTVTGGVSPYTYSWAGSCALANCTNMCAGIYTLTVTDNHSCSASANATVTEPATGLSLTMGSVAAHCNQSDGVDSVVVSGGTPGYSYSWMPGGGVTATYTSLAPGMYTVAVADAHQCIAVDSLRVQNIPGITASITGTTPTSCYQGSNGTATASATGAVGTVTYSWSPAGGNAAAASGLSAGTYTCYLTDGAGCRDKASATVTQPSQVTVTGSAHSPVCINQTDTLHALGAGGTPGYTYSWTNASGPVTATPAPVVTTTYTVNCTDANGCAAVPKQVTVTVRPPLQVTVTGNASVCTGGSAPLSASGTGGDGAYTYSWSPAAGLTNANIFNPVATPAATITYTVFIHDGCTTPPDSNTVQVVVYPVPVPAFTASDTQGCAPLCVTFQNTTIPNCQSATWTFGDQGSGAGCDSTKHCYAAAGTYTCEVIVKDIHGCKGSSTRPNYIRVHPLPVARFTASPQPTTMLEPKIAFHDTSTGAVDQHWFFQGLKGAMDSSLSPKYTYPDTGCYPVILAVRSAFGCVDTARSPVCISPFFTFYIPDAFTPNGDGLNDVWLPKAEDADPSHYEASVYDRWGNRVFYTTTWGIGWDGKANGGPQIAQEDTYVYLIQARDFKGNRYTYRGIVSLIK